MGEPPIRNAAGGEDVASETLAAVDLGSNSFHLIVARDQGNEPVIVDRLREMVQLAAGLEGGRQLSESARSRAIDCLERFGERIRHIPEENVRAVGTNTLRQAQDTARFLDRAEEALGHSVETISGREEARLIYLGVAHSSPGNPERRLVIDIGGGSTEVIVGSGFDPLRMESLYMGCVSMSRRFFGTGVINTKRWSAAELGAATEFEPIASVYRDLGWEIAYGASGTIRTVQLVAEKAGWSGAEITLKSLKKVRDALIKAGQVDAVRLEGLSSRRRTVFAGGVAVLCAAFELMGIDEMRVSDGALREGLLYDLLGRRVREDVRQRTVSSLAQRYHVDRDHGERVRQTAQELLDRGAESWRLEGEPLRRLLGWACQLHELGLDIAHSHYHKHGAYVIAASDLFGFSRDEQQRLALLVQAHRRKFPVAAFQSLPRKQGRRLERLAILLRLAATLHRSRAPQPFPAPRVACQKRSIELVFEPGWLEARPLTRADLEHEREYLGAAGYRLRYR